MKIIGIKIDKSVPTITKNLKGGKFGWYPIGNYIYPVYKNQHWDWRSDGTQHEDDQFVDQLYKSPLSESKITDSSFAKLRISVSCIVGQNGSGKTTLLEIFLRIINNFSIRVFDAIKWNLMSGMPEGRHLRYADGVYASIIYEDYGNLYAIRCKGDKVFFIEYKNDGSTDEKEVKESSRGTIGYWKQILSSNFFYTIYTNYSIYSFNEDDYCGELEAVASNAAKKVNGDWIRGLLDKNDGYNAPIVVVPYRVEGGGISPKKEEELAIRRLSTLAVLYKVHKSEFFGGYEIDSIDYSFDSTSKSLYDQRWKALTYSRFPANFQSGDCARWQGKLTEIWNSRLSGCKMFSRGKNLEIKDALVSYLCYKTIKICATYREYGRFLGVKKLPIDMQKKFPSDIVANALHTDSKQIDFNPLIDMFFQSGLESHITLKIRQCIDFAQNGYYKQECNSLQIGQFIKSIKLWPNQVKDRNVSYNDVYLRMPPPIYRYNVWCHRTGEQSGKLVTFSKMSSGERHLMCALSYILYHVNNVLSVKRNPDRIAYKHINIVLDEIELYYHPEYQRLLLYRLMDMLSVCQLNTEQIESINLLLVTHSPFVLSDVPSSRILYLKNGNVEHAGCGKTLAANISDLFANKFFLDKGFMGELARRNLEKCLIWLENNDEKTQDNVFYKSLIDEIGDPLLQQYFVTYKSNVYS